MIREEGAGNKQHVVKGYKDLIVGLKSIELVLEIYTVTKLFPKNEEYGLSSQLRRAAVSVPSNIVEGSRRSNKEFVRFLGIADGSISEVKTQVIVAKKLYPSENYNKVFELILEKCRK